VRDARAAGIAMVHQELSVAPDLSVAENVFLGAQPTNRFGFVQWRRMAREAGEQLARFGIDVDPMSRLGDLPIGLQQLIEIARVLFSGARIIILDEPTSALSPPEVERLFATLRRLRDQGTAIVFTSHFIEDILRVSDLVTVFRNGRKVAETPAAETDKATLIEAMIGKGREALEETYAHDIALPPPNHQPVVLSAGQLSLAKSLRDVSFEVRSGEPGLPSCLKAAAPCCSTRSRSTRISRSASWSGSLRCSSSRRRNATLPGRRSISCRSGRPPSSSTLACSRAAISRRWRWRSG
jgi:ribose transport system ATP-binding protein